MTDPRKPTHRPTGADEDEVRDFIHSVLISATGHIAQGLKCTGVSIVTMGIGIWAAELAELDSKAAAQLLRALADMVDDRSSPASRAEAENRRAYAAQRLHQALDTMMARSAGRA